MIKTHQLVKRFGRVHAVDGIDLDVRPGDIYGFLGANGSGKTTTVRMLLGLIAPTSGTVAVLGEPMPRAARTVLPRIGALVESPAAYGHLSGHTNLMLLDASGVREHADAGGASRPVSSRSRRARRVRVDAALEQVGLGHVGRRPVKAYSLGMRQRLGLAGALLRQPELLVLDEPTNGLDPQGIHEIRELLLDLHRRGTTVLISSHLLAEVEALATRVGVLDRGKLVLQDQLVSLQAPTGLVEIRTMDPDRAAARLGPRVVWRDGDRLVAELGDQHSGQLNADLVTAGVRVLEFAPQRRTLEQVVLAAAAASGDRIGEADPRRDAHPAPEQPVDEIIMGNRP